MHTLRKVAIVDGVTMLVKLSGFLQIVLCIGVVLFGVLQAVRQPNSTWLSAAVLVFVIVGLVVGRRSEWRFEILVLGFLFCLLPAARYVVSTHISIDDEYIYHARPAVFLAAVGAALALFRSKEVKARNNALLWRRILVCCAVVCCATLILGYAVLSRRYALESRVLSESLMNALLVLCGYFMFRDLMKTEATRAFSTLFLLAGLTTTLFVSVLAGP